jgi:PAS domain S-box-containing protein
MRRLRDSFVQALLDAASEGVFVKDKTGRIIYCNRAAQQILGSGGEKVAGASADECNAKLRPVHEDGTPFHRDEQPSAVTLRTGKSCTNVVMGLWDRSACARRWVSVSTKLVPGRPPASPWVFAILTDIAAHVAEKQRANQAASALARTEAYLRNVLNAIPDPIWITDPDGAATFCNLASARLFGGTDGAGLPIAPQPGCGQGFTTCWRCNRERRASSRRASVRSMVKFWMSKPSTRPCVTRLASAWVCWPLRAISRGASRLSSICGV